jgi:PEP-CTERM motif
MIFGTPVQTNAPAPSLEDDKTACVSRRTNRQTACIWAAILAIFAAAMLANPTAARAAAIAGSVDFTDTTSNGTTFTYNLTLNNLGTTGADDIQTFWFSWIPGQDFMPTPPTNIISPPGWTETVINAGAGDGYSIEWHTTSGTAAAPSSSAVKPGISLSGFSFQSATTPTQMTGFSPDHPIYEVETTFLYSGQPELGDGVEIISMLVPEPSSLWLAGIGMLFAWPRLRQRHPSPFSD